jgi:hypothetical protein
MDDQLHRGGIMKLAGDEAPARGRLCSTAMEFADGARNSACSEKR